MVDFEDLKAEGNAEAALRVGSVKSVNLKHVVFRRKEGRKERRKEGKKDFPH
jgi:hypothetical protein